MTCPSRSRSPLLSYALSLHVKYQISQRREPGHCHPVLGVRPFGGSEVQENKEGQQVCSHVKPSTIGVSERHIPGAVVCRNANSLFEIQIAKKTTYIKAAHSPRLFHLDPPRTSRADDLIQLHIVCRGNSIPHRLSPCFRAQGASFAAISRQLVETDGCCLHTCIPYVSQEVLKRSLASAGSENNFSRHRLSRGTRG